MQRLPSAHSKQLLNGMNRMLTWLLDDCQAPTVCHITKQLHRIERLVTNLYVPSYSRYSPHFTEPEPVGVHALPSHTPHFKITCNIIPLLYSHLPSGLVLPFIFLHQNSVNILFLPTCVMCHTPLPQLHLS